MRRSVFTAVLAIAMILVALLFVPSVSVSAGCSDRGYDENGKPCTPPSTTQSATTSTNQTAQQACEAGSASSFLGFPTWHRGFPCDDKGNIKIEGGSPFDIVVKIALNIIDIALRLAGIVAVGFVIWGGFQYVISQGEPEKAKKALRTILNAVIGLVITMVAAVVVTFIVSRLGA